MSRKDFGGRVEGEDTGRRKGEDTGRRNYLRYAGAAALTGLAGCTGTFGGNSKNASDTVTLAGTMPLTGSLSSVGKAILGGYRSAVQKINADGGVPVGGTNYELKLNIKDDASSPSKATAKYQEFLTQGNVDFFLGSFSSGIVLPTASIVAKNDKLMLQSGGGSDKIFTQGWDNIYGIYPRASRQMIPTVNFFESLQPMPETFSVITENDPYSQSLSKGVRNLLKEAGIEVVANHEVPEGATDVSAVVSEVKSESPNGLFVAGHGGVAQQVAKQVSTREVNLDVFYEVLGPWQPSYLDSVGKAGNYVTTITYFSEKMETKGGEVFDSAGQFASYTRENVRDVPSPFNHQIASGAAAIVSYYHGMKNAGELDPGAVGEALDELSTSSFYGAIEFTEAGDGHPNKMGPMVAQVQGDQYEVVHPDESASADPKYPIPVWDDR